MKILQNLELNLLLLNEFERKIIKKFLMKKFREKFKNRSKVCRDKKNDFEYYQKSSAAQSLKSSLYEEDN